jgi:hypothetical protein
MRNILKGPTKILDFWGRGEISVISETPAVRQDEVVKPLGFPENLFDFEGRGEMSGTTSRPPNRWSGSSETHLDEVVRSEGIEPPTLGAENQCSNPLSYERIFTFE